MTLKLAEAIRRLSGVNKNASQAEIEKKVQEGLKSQHIPLLHRNWSPKKKARITKNHKLPSKDKPQKKPQKKAQKKPPKKPPNKPVTSSNKSSNKSSKAEAEDEYDNSILLDFEEEDDACHEQYLKDRAEKERRFLEHKAKVRAEQEEAFERCEAERVKAIIRKKKLDQQKQEKLTQSVWTMKYKKVGPEEPEAKNKLWSTKYCQVYYCADKSKHVKFKNWMINRLKKTDRSTSKAESNKPVCLLRGPSGCGKTVLLNMVFQELDIKPLVFSPFELSTNATIQEKFETALFASGFAKNVAVVIDGIEHIEKKKLLRIVAILSKLTMKNMTGTGKRKRHAPVKSPPRMHPLIFIGDDTKHPSFGMVGEFCYALNLNKVSIAAMTQMLKDICDKEQVKVPKKLESSMSSCRGNLRALLNRVQFETNFGMDQNIGTFEDLFHTLNDIRRTQKLNTLPHIEQAMEYHSVQGIVTGMHTNLHHAWSTSREPGLADEDFLDQVSNSCDSFSDFDSLGYSHEEFAPACIVTAMAPFKPDVTPARNRNMRANVHSVDRTAFNSASDIACCVRGLTRMALLDEVSILDQPYCVGGLGYESHMFCRYDVPPEPDRTSVCPISYSYGKSTVDVSEKTVNGMHKSLYLFPRKDVLEM